MKIYSKVFNKIEKIEWYLSNHLTYSHFDWKVIFLKKSIKNQLVPNVWSTTVNQKYIYQIIFFLQLQVFFAKARVHSELW